MTARQIADALGVHVGTIGEHAHRVREQIQREELPSRGRPVVYLVRGDRRPAPVLAVVRPARCTCGDCASCDVQGMRREQQARPARVPPPPPSGTRLVRGLPVLREGPGDRDETCVEYTGCLTRFVHASAANRAHCPTSCTERRRVDWRVERDEHAGRRDASALTF